MASWAVRGAQESWPIRRGKARSLFHPVCKQPLGHAQTARVCAQTIPPTFLMKLRGGLADSFAQSSVFIQGHVHRAKGEGGAYCVKADQFLPREAPVKPRPFRHPPGRLTAARED